MFDDLFSLSVVAAAIAVIVLLFVSFMYRRVSHRPGRQYPSYDYSAPGRHPGGSAQQVPPQFSQVEGSKGWASVTGTRRDTDFEWRVQRIEDLLNNLEQVQKQAIRHNQQLNESFLERVEKLEKLAEAWNLSGGRPPTNVPLMHTKEFHEHHDQDRREEEVPSYGSPDPEEVGFELLRLIEPAGRLAPLARLSGLHEWLKRNYPNIKVEPIGILNQDLWLLLVLTSDGKAGVVLPALDSIIGPGEVLEWFEGGRYDGTQALLHANISSLARAVWDENAQRWQPHVKGRIDLT